MKKWKIILASVLAMLVMGIVPLSVMAQTQSTPNTTSTPVFQGGLAIVAPRVVLVGKEMQLTVFLRHNQTPLAGVNVWAVSSNNTAALKAAVKAVRQDTSIKPADKDYSGVLAQVNAISLGQTQTDGKIIHTFTDVGNYLLVGYEKGHGLDFSALAVRQVRQALAISAPRTAKVGAAVTITVHQRGNTNPVGGAGVWAIAPDKAAALKAQITASKPANGSNAQATPQVDWASILNVQATRLGNTDSSGQVSYTFTNTGRNILVTFENGYVPGLGAIRITPIQPAPTASETP